MYPIEAQGGHKLADIEALDVRVLKGVSMDSRGVKRGFLFAAVPGSKLDGHKFIADAIMNGASHIIAKPGTILPENAGPVVLIEDAEPRRAFARVVSKFYGAQPKMIVAVTGTNGKTSTVHFINQLWRMMDVKSAALGTLGLSVKGSPYAGAALTTPDTVSLHAELADLAAVGVEHLAMEASSHGLHQFRLDAVKIKIAAFTNFSRDHLDYHPSMEAYLAAKLRLFTDVLLPGGVAVLNADLPEYSQIRAACEMAGHRVLSYGLGGKEFKIGTVISMPQGQALDLHVMGRAYQVILPLVGGFQSMNAVCALACIVAEAPDDHARTQKLIKGMERLKGVPGRLELVPGRQDYAAYVDFAHKPQALEAVLQTLRPHTKGRLICLFGCGGDRDQGKRPVMGEIAAALSDVVIVTDDNPRTEDAGHIRAQIMKGASGAKVLHEVAGRRAAIEKAVEMMQSGDVLLVAGKGHEKVQIFKGYSENFDDVKEVENAMQSLRKP